MRTEKFGNSTSSDGTKGGKINMILWHINGNLSMADTYSDKPEEKSGYKVVTKAAI